METSEPGLGEAEDVVDEEQRVGAFFVAEVLGDGESGQRDAQTGSGGLGHLAVDQRGLGFLGLLDVDDARLLHFEPEIVAFAGALANAGEHGESAVLQCDVVDEFHDDDGLADASATEQADLAALQEGLDEVDDLDAGLEHLGATWTARRKRGAARWMGMRFSQFTGPSLSTGSPMTLSTRPSVPLPRER